MSKLVASLVVASLCLGLSSAGAQSIQDATIADAEAHQVVFENEHVRVLQVLAAPGHKSAMHSHPPLVVISLGTARVRVTSPDGTQQILDLRPGTFFWTDGTEHSWELLAGQVNVMAVEVKSAKKPASD